MMRFFHLFFLFLLVLQPCLGDELYIKNREFKGPASGSGASLQVGLEALIQALGLQSRKDSGGWLVSRQSIGSELSTVPGLVTVEGVTVPLLDNPEGPMVNLADFLKPLSMEVVSNPALGVLDVREVRDSAKTAALSSGGISGPKKVVMQYYEALQHFPEMTSISDMTNAREVTRGFRDMMNEMRPLVTQKMLAGMEENHKDVIKRSVQLSQIASRMGQKKVEAELEADPKLRAFLQKFFDFTRMVSWMRPVALEEQVDGGTAIVRVTLPNRNGKTPDPIAVSLVKVREKWLIDMIDGKRLGVTAQKR